VALQLDSRGGKEGGTTEQKKLGCNVGDPMASSEARMALQNDPPLECGGPHLQTGAQGLTEGYPGRGRDLGQEALTL